MHYSLSVNWRLEPQNILRRKCYGNAMHRQTRNDVRLQINFKHQAIKQLHQHHPVQGTH